MVDDFAPEFDDGARPAAPTSQLAGLRAQREKATKALYVDLLVPRYETPIYVRYGPMPEPRMNAINKQAEKSKDPERNVIANAAALAECCIGVFAVLIIGGEETKFPVDDADQDGDWPKFDERLAGILGLEDTTKATAVVRGLYLTDGDVLATASKLAEWSGYSLQGVEEREGN